MVRSYRSLALLLAALPLAGLMGCGAAPAGKTVVLNSFENVPDPSASSQVYDLVESLKKPNLPTDDYGWTTSGYVSLEPFKKYATQGKTSCKARFTIPGDFKKPGQKPKAWEAGLKLETGGATALTVTDWSAYKYLAIDITNTEDKEYQAGLRVTDSFGKVTETANLVKAKGKTVAFIEVTRLAEARLNINDIKALTLYMDTVDQPVDPVLYIDNVRLTANTVLR